MFFIPTQAHKPRSNVNAEVEKSLKRQESYCQYDQNILRLYEGQVVLDGITQERGSNCVDPSVEEDNSK
jgi:hypothetical protein